MNQIIESFIAFKTEEHLPEDWVKNVWLSNGFTSYIPFPAEYDVFLEEVTIADILDELDKALKEWFRLSGTSLKEVIINYSNADPGFSQECVMNWQTLVNEGIDYKAIICVIGTLILRFLEDSTNMEYFMDALFAVRLYLYLVAIPGSHILQIFNSTLYSHAMSIIRISCEQIDSSVSGKGKGVKRKKGEEDEDMETDVADSRLTCDKSTLIRLTNNFLTSLKLIIFNKKLKFDDTSLNLTVQILLMITRLEKVYSSILANNLNNYPKDSVSYLTFKSFNILQNVSCLLHSNPNESAKRMIRELLPIFLVNEWRNLGLTLKDASIIRTNCTFFLKSLLDILGEAVYDAINILVQRICLLVPDRAEMRMKASNIVIDILKISPPDLLAEEIYSIVYMSHMPETKTRLFTLEIISKLLLETESSISFSQLPQKYAAVTSEEFLLAVIFYRCKDVSISIKTKALSYLDQFISSANTNKKVKAIVDKIFVDPFSSVEDPESVPAYHKEIFNTQQYVLEARFLDDRSLNPLPGVKIILNMLVYFSQEDKVFIKKSAIQTLAKILLFSHLWIKKHLLEVFVVGCVDSSVLIRKTMGQILTDLIIMYPDHPDVIVSWVEGVVPMIAEEEAKAQEKVIEHFSKIILNNMMMYDHTNSVVSRLPWCVMNEILKQDKRSYLHFTVGKWVQMKLVKSKLISIIYSHVDTENNIIAWCLLVSLSQFMDLPNPDQIFQYYQRILPRAEEVSYNQLVLETLFYVSPNLPKDIKCKLVEQLEKDLVSCTLPLKLIARSRDICECILVNLASDKKNCHGIIIDWSTPKIAICLDYIKKNIWKNAPIEIENPETLIKYIYLLGELAQAAPHSINKSDIKMLQNLLLSPKKREDDAWKGRVSHSVKAITVLTLVKLVLQHEDIANAIMPIFREILSTSSVDPTVQVNTIIGMCDLCSRYTTLVERYFICICKCFNSTHENVRTTALHSVMKRIREEYVKLRPFILFPMLTMILDESIFVKRTVATFIEVDLKKKNNILEMFYTGLFFFLNNCKRHSTTVKIPEDLRTMFSLTDKPEQRNYIYIFVLDKLADTNRRLVMCKKIVNDILGSVADEILPVDEKVENIMNDAFRVLIDNERKISEAITKSKKSNNEEVEEIEEVNEAGASQSKKVHGHSVVVTESMRLNEANDIIPIILKLRLVLKKQKSKCMTSLVSYLCELMRNFKHEIADMLSNDPDLKAEVEYNIKRLEKDEEERARADSAEIADTVENKSEDENRNIEVLTTSPEEICEQLQNLIVQLTRCDSEDQKSNKGDKESVDLPIVSNEQDKESVELPIVKLPKCDRFLSQNTEGTSQQKEKMDTGEKNSSEEEDVYRYRSKEKKKDKKHKNEEDIEPAGETEEDHSDRKKERRNKKGNERNLKSGRRKDGSTNKNPRQKTDKNKGKLNRNQDTENCIERTENKKGREKIKGITPQTSPSKIEKPNTENKEQFVQKAITEQYVRTEQRNFKNTDEAIDEEIEEFIENSMEEVNGPIEEGQEKFSSDEEI